MNEKWINVAKAIGIIAVIIDHTTGVLYKNQYIKTASFFSVSLFILVMGITSYWSYSNGGEEIRKKVFRRSKALIISYGISVVVYCIIAYKQLDFLTVIVHFINFNVSGPHYYVLLYLQLLLLSPIVYFFIRWSEKDGQKALIKQIFWGGVYSL